jgi:hypothetical protein
MFASPPKATGIGALIGKDAKRRLQGEGLNMNKFPRAFLIAPACCSRQ